MSHQVSSSTATRGSKSGLDTLDTAPAQLSPLDLPLTTDPEEIGRMIGIAAGSDYATLNNTQCTIDFQPAQFNVTVDTINRNITVTPIKGVVCKHHEH
jgi:hypothetical protein